jgi:hypothetical protein
MLADHHGVRYDVELPVGIVDLGKLCGIPVHTRRISVQGHFLWNFEDYRGRGLSPLSYSCNTRELKLMIGTSDSGDHSALLRQVMVLRDGIHASIDLLPVSSFCSCYGNDIAESIHGLTLRDDFNPPFIALFAVLYFLRSFHWIAGDRIDYVSQLNLS